jgi:hypothetical protein
MKCIKNKTTGNIIRVDEKQAYQMVGNTWQYVSKTEWKKANGSIKEETAAVSHDMGGPVETKIEKKRSKKKAEA